MLVSTSCDSCNFFLHIFRNGKHLFEKHILKVVIELVVTQIISITLGIKQWGGGMGNTHEKKFEHRIAFSEVIFIMLLRWCSSWHWRRNAPRRQSWGGGGGGSIVCDQWLALPHPLTKQNLFAQSVQVPVFPGRFVYNTKIPEGTTLDISIAD